MKNDKNAGPELIPRPAYLILANELDSGLRSTVKNLGLRYTA